jgi:Protein of unknown function (DUF664)
MGLVVQHGTTPASLHVPTTPARRCLEPPGAARLRCEWLTEDGPRQRYFSLQQLRQYITWERMSEVLDCLEEICREAQASRDRHEPRSGVCDYSDLVPDQKPPRLAAGELETLLALLQYQRDSLVRKVAGLDDAAALAHLLEETARHAGHADILGELIDGRTGR